MIENVPSGAEAPEQEPVPHEQPEETAAQGNEQDAPNLNEVEKVASAMGWSPKENWRGSPDVWIPAEKFLQNTAEINKSLKQRIDRQQQDFEKRTERANHVAEAALVNQRTQLWQQWESAKDNAVATGDIDYYRRLQQGQTQAIRQFDERIAPVVREPQAQPEVYLPPDVVDAVSDFKLRNRDWYEKDGAANGAMTKFAVDALNEVDAEFPLASIGWRLKEVERRVGETFPGRIKGGSQQPQGSGVEGGLRPIRTTRGKGFNELPPEAKTAASRFVAQKAFKDVHEYAKEYWKQES